MSSPNPFSLATDQFSAYVSFKSHTEYVHIITDILLAPFNLACENIPIHTFDINTSGRYLKLSLDTHHGQAAAMKYVKINYEETCGKYRQRTINRFVLCLVSRNHRYKS